MSFAISSIAGPSRLATRLCNARPALSPALGPWASGAASSSYRRSALASSYSTTTPRLQSRRQAYTLAQPINTPSGFEGVPAPAYVNPVDPAQAGSAGASGKGKEKAGIVEGHAPPPPAPSEVKPRRKIQAKKAAITMVGPTFKLLWATSGLFWPLGHLERCAGTMVRMMLVHCMLIQQTQTAVDRLRALMSTPNPQLLRIGVKTRGCAGMAYHLEYVSPPGGKFDEVVEQDGVRVLIDSKALFSIIGSRMDWRDTRLSAGFVFDNPNVVDSCGCGESFNIRF